MPYARERIMLRRRHAEVTLIALRYYMDNAQIEESVRWSAAAAADHITDLLAD
jgi:hypothetical protein